MMALAVMIGLLFAQAEDRLFPVIEGNRWGYIDIQGKVVIAPQFREARRFVEGRGAVAAPEGWGVVDSTGKLVVPCIYNVVRPFSEGLAAVQGNDLLWGAVDLDGKIVIPVQYAVVGPCWDGLVRVRKKGPKEPFSFLDKKGAVALSGLKDFQVVGDFREGLACVDNGSFIDKKGKVVFRTSGLAKPFSEGLAAFTTSSGAGYYLDRSGKVVIGPPAKVEAGVIRLDTSGMTNSKFWGGESFSEGLALVMDASNRLYGYLDPKGNYAIPPRFTQARSFSDGRAYVEWRDNDNRTQQAFIDKKGEVVVPLEFGWRADSFAGGLSRVGNSLNAVGWSWRYIDPAGKVVWQLGGSK